LFKKLKENEGVNDINNIYTDFMNLKKEELGILAQSFKNDSKLDIFKDLSEDIEKRIEKYYNINNSDGKAKF
jgi:hypothetical protein